MRRYPAYRDSGVEWLGKVPAHWAVDRIKASVASCRNGIWGDEPDGGNDDIKCVRVADLDRARLVVREHVPTLRRVTPKERIGRLLSQGDLLLEKSGGGESQPVGQVVQYRNLGLSICSNFVARMSLAPGMVSAYWNYVHNAVYSVGLNVGAINQTSGIQNLDQDRYFNERAPFPPFDEQKAIAAFLDHETAKIDALIAEQEKLIALLAEKRQATISHAVTHGLDLTAQLRDTGMPWLGQVPSHWKLSQLKHVAKPGTSITYGIVQAGPHVLGGIPYIKTSDMAGESLSPDGMSRTSVEIDASYARSKVVAGDIVIAIRATVGKCLPVPAELAGANLTQGTAKVTPGPDVLPEFLLHYLRATPAQTYFDAMAKGATFKEITLDALRRTPMAVPPLDEQRSIASELQERVRVFDQLALDAEAAIALLRERRSALITAAVTGQIDVRGTMTQ